MNQHRQPADSSRTDRASRERPPASNFATALAVLAMMVLFIGLMGFLAVFGDKLFLGIFGVFLFFGLVGGFHYVTWGWWLSQVRDDDDAPAE